MQAISTDTPAARSVWQFSLATVFWIITGTALALGLTSWIPGTGILWAVSFVGIFWAVAAARHGYHRLAFSLASIAAGPLVAWLLVKPISPYSHYVFEGRGLFGYLGIGIQSIPSELYHGLITSLAFLIAAWTVRRKLRKARAGMILMLGTLMSVIAATLYVPLFILGILAWTICTKFSDISSIDFSDTATGIFYLLPLFFTSITSSITIALLSFHVCGLPITLLAWLLRRLDPIECELSSEDWRLIDALEMPPRQQTDSADDGKNEIDFNNAQTQSQLWHLMGLGIIANDEKGYFYRGLHRFRRLTEANPATD